MAMNLRYLLLIAEQALTEFGKRVSFWNHLESCHDETDRIYTVGSDLESERPLRADGTDISSDSDRDFFGVWP